MTNNHINNTIMNKKHFYTLLAAATMVLLAACGGKKESYPIDKAVYDRLPFEMEEVQLPTFPD